MKTLRLVVSYQCPLRCDVCYARATHSQLTVPRKLLAEVVENAASEGFEAVALGGGEPLYTLPHTLKASREASRAGLRVAVTTSGYGLDGATLKKLEGAGLNHLQLSLGDNRVNILGAYRFMLKARRHCTFGVNLLLSPRLVPLLPMFIKRFDLDGVDQTTLLLPKGGYTLRFTRDEFMRYYTMLHGVRTEHTTVLIDCATQQILSGRCESEGCSFFPDGMVSRCAFGCGRRVPWSGSLTEAMADDRDECREGLTVLSHS